MKKIILNTLFLFLAFSISAQNIIQAEYYWDVDPGQGNGTSLSVLDGNFNEALESVFQNNSILPSVGNHVLGIRIKATDGNWGTVFKRVFRVDANNNSNNLCKITQAEYYWDTDPGNGNGIALVAFDGNFSNALESIFKSNASLPSTGNHVLGIRIKATDGNWGTVFKRVFKVDANNNSNNLCKITQAEYFWDTDPGNGNGIALVAFDGNFNAAFEQLSKNAVSLPNSGLHLLNVRTKTSDGNWGTVYKKVIGVDIIAGTVNLNYPNDVATCVGIVDSLMWNGVTGFSTFEYELATDSTFNNIVSTAVVNDTLVHLTNLDGNTDYFWRVRVQSGSLVGLWSEVWRFSTVSTSELSETICSGSSYVFGSQTLSQAGSYEAVFTSSSGCDSIVSLTLSVNNTITNTITETICGNDTYTLGTQSLTQSGTYNETFASSGGCDSIVTLNLTVETPIVLTLEETICNGDAYVLGTQTYNQSGTYNQVFTAVNGCDSTITLNLTVLNAITTTITETICAGDSYTVGSNTYSQTGNYTTVLTSVGGCDSTILLDLTVFALPTTVVNYANGGLVSSSGANYQWFLDGNEINGAIDQNYSPASNGCYTVVITDNNCTDTSSCYNVIDVSIHENWNRELVLYPNPAKNFISFDLDKEVVIAGNVFNVNGKLMLSFSHQNKIDLSNLAKGTYILQLETNQGFVNKLFLKN